MSPVSELDEAAASALAAEEGRDVVVESETTETTQVVAQSDGTFELTINTVPVRVQQDGAWVPVDSTLVPDESGYLAPTATSVPVQFSSGGSDVLARVQSPDGSLRILTRQTCR